MIGLGDFSLPNIFIMIFPPTMNNPENSHFYLYLLLYLSALSIISIITELILHSLSLSKQSDLLTLYNFEANPNYLFVTGLCYILKFLKQLQIPKQSLLGNFWIARTVNTLPTLEPLIKNESRNSMSFNNWSNIVVVYQSNQMIKSLISGVLYFSKIESLQDSKELYKTGQTCTLSHGWHTAESSLIITSKWLWNKKSICLVTIFVFVFCDIYICVVRYLYTSIS